MPKMMIRGLMVTMMTTMMMMMMRMPLMMMTEEFVSFQAVYSIFFKNLAFIFN